MTKKSNPSALSASLVAESSPAVDTQLVNRTGEAAQANGLAISGEGGLLVQHAPGEVQERCEPLL